MSGTKFDAGKAPLSLIPYEAQIAEAEVLAFGARKYAAHNWRGGFEWTRLLDAAMRHLAAFNAGEDKDPESGLSHLAHARCCVGFLIAHERSGLGVDNRYTPTPKAPTAPDAVPAVPQGAAGVVDEPANTLKCGAVTLGDAVESATLEAGDLVVARKGAHVSTESTQFDVSPDCEYTVEWSEPGSVFLKETGLYYKASRFMKSPVRPKKWQVYGEKPF